MLAYFVRKCIYKAVNQSKSFTSIAWFCFAFKFCTNLLFLKGERVGNKTFVVPSVEHSFCGVVVHHRVVTILVCELYARNPLFPCLGVIGKVDGGGFAAAFVNTVNHSTSYKSISHIGHPLCAEKRRVKIKCKIDKIHSAKMCIVLIFYFISCFVEKILLLFVIRYHTSGGCKAN